jgi:hypothetical protein
VLASAPLHYIAQLIILLLLDKLCLITHHYFSLFPQVHQDMSAPFSHYFIFTGHNSYLTGNQLNSDSSDIPIIKSLQRGVRVIELDMWPNSSKNNVDILHGGYEFCSLTILIIFCTWNDYNIFLHDILRYPFFKMKGKCIFFLHYTTM